MAIGAVCPLNADNAITTADADTLRVVDVEEIAVVATPKENKKLRQLPAAVTLLSQQQMQAAQVKGIKSLTAVVPNLFIPDYGSALTSAIYIRGIGSRINTPSVGLYVDNIPYINQSAFDFGYADVERIDVLRGPQATLYGRNAMGGLIKIHTKSPFSYQGTDLRLGAATHNAYNGSLTHYHRVNEHFAFSTGGFYNYNGGFFRNQVNNDRMGQNQQASGRFRGILLPTDNWKLDLNLSYEYTDQNGYPYFYMGTVNEAAQSEQMKPYIGTIAHNEASSYYRNLFNVGLNIEHQADRFTLSAVTGYQMLKDRMYLDQDFTPADIFNIEQRQKLHTLSEEIVLKSKGDSRWQWTTGAFGFYQSMNTQGPVNFTEGGMRMLSQMIGQFIPANIPVQAGPMTMNIKPSLTVNSTTLPISGNFDTPTINGALFHQSTFQDLFGVEGLSFTAGLRLDYERMKLDYHSATAMDYTVGIKGELTRGSQVIREIEMMAPTALTVQSGYQGKLDRDYLQLLPKVALQYDLPNRQGNVYATVSKGYRSGGYNIQMFSDLIQTSLQNDMMNLTKAEILKVMESSSMGNQYKELFEQNFPSGGENPKAEAAVIYKPEYTWNYEVGTHLNLFNSRLTVDAALFCMDTRNQQLSRFAESGLGRVTVNAGRSRSLGAEAQLSAALCDVFTLHAGYGYTYATFRDYVTNVKVNGKLQEVDYKGHYVPFVPKHTLNAGGDFLFKMKRNQWLDAIRLNLNYSAAGRIYWTEANTESASQSFYGTLNGRLSLQKGNGEINLWVRNALNKDYAAFYFESMGNRFMQKGNPIQAGIELRCRF